MDRAVVQTSMRDVSAAEALLATTTAWRGGCGEEVVLIATGRGTHHCGLAQKFLKVLGSWVTGTLEFGVLFATFL